MLLSLPTDLQICGMCFSSSTAGQSTMPLFSHWKYMKFLPATSLPFFIPSVGPSSRWLLDGKRGHCAVVDNLPCTQGVPVFSLGHVCSGDLGTLKLFPPITGNTALLPGLLRLHHAFSWNRQANLHITCSESQETKFWALLHPVPFLWCLGITKVRSPDRLPFNPFVLWNTVHCSLDLC